MLKVPLAICYLLECCSGDSKLGTFILWPVVQIVGALGVRGYEDGSVQPVAGC